MTDNDRIRTDEHAGSCPNAFEIHQRFIQVARVNPRKARVEVPAVQPTALHRRIGERTGPAPLAGPIHRAGYARPRRLS